MIEKNENYKLKGKDFIPFIGQKQYCKRNGDVLEKRLKRFGNRLCSWYEQEEGEKIVITRECLLGIYNAAVSLPFILPLAYTIGYTFEKFVNS